MPRCPEILGALFGRFEGRTRVDLAASSATLLLVAGVRSPPFFVFFRPVGPWDLISKQLIHSVVDNGLFLRTNVTTPR